MGKKKKIIIVMLVLLFLFFAIVIGTITYYTSKINKVTQSVLQPEDFETDANIDPNREKIDYVDWGDAAYMLEDDDLLNIILLGQDKRSGQTRQRSDVMILCSLNPQTGKVVLISFMRDLYVQIPEYNDNRLNAAYVFGGFELVKETFTKNFGIHIDGCFEVDFTAFETIVDMIDGVDITLTDAEAQYINKRCDGYLKIGENHLNGKQALTYVSIRAIDSDFERTGRQRKFLVAVYKKLKTQKATELLDLLNTALPYLTTDMSNIQIQLLAARALTMLPSIQIGTYRVPPDNGSYDATINGMMVLVPKLDVIHDYLVDAMGID
ncbi:MAG TPA: LCP family protein [Clostridiales bacterium]|nr:LCP family protein [Clostridiales bacterium]